jgi:hypothetical protein
MVPLDDCRFNHAKSNITWFEATMTGAACIGPNFPEWQWNGVVRYESPETFSEQIDYLLRNPKVAIEATAQSWETIQQNFLVEFINERRRSCLRSLLR